MASARAIELLRDLVAFPSVSSVSNSAITDYIGDVLKPLPLRSERLNYLDENREVKSNILATSGNPGDSGGLLYCAHSDVVPVDRWEFPDAGPFELHESGGKLFGRGSCDMKGSLACFLAAMESIPASDWKRPISVLVTSDEEVGYVGADHVVKQSEVYRQLCEQQPLTVIGEPTSLSVVHAHKGVYVLHAVSHGVAGHSSTDAGLNSNLAMIPFLQEMAAIYEETRNAPEWQNDEFSPPTISWNIGVNDFTYASNITPERTLCTVCFRPMPGQDADSLVQRARNKADELGLEFEVHQSAAPLYVKADADHITAMAELTASKPHTVAYGTDGARLTALQNLVVCGPGNIAQAHTVDEFISLEQIEKGVALYARLIRHFCC
ncbi:M20 family metallopeptidase [bacterium]|nr:M20 family metallopeptidase [bacterium]